MSIPKEKLIIFKIREIVNNRVLYSKQAAVDKIEEIKKIVMDYEDPGYIGGPVVGEEIAGIVHPGRLFVSEEGLKKWGEDNQPPMEYYENGGK